MDISTASHRSNVKTKADNKAASELSQQQQHPSMKLFIDAKSDDSETKQYSMLRPWNKHYLGLVVTSSQQEDEAQVSTLQTMHHMLSLTGRKMPLLKESLLAPSPERK